MTCLLHCQALDITADSRPASNSRNSGEAGASLRLEVSPVAVMISHPGMPSSQSLLNSLLTHLLTRISSAAEPLTPTRSCTKVCVSSYKAHPPGPQEAAFDAREAAFALFLALRPPPLLPPGRDDGLLLLTSLRDLAPFAVVVAIAGALLRR